MKKMRNRIIVGERPAHVPAGWIIINAPRPIFGHCQWMGEFVTGRFYAAINPAEANADGLYAAARRDAAAVLAYIAEDDAFARGREMLIGRHGATAEVIGIVDDPNNRSWVISRCVETLAEILEGFPAFGIE